MRRQIFVLSLLLSLLLSACTETSRSALPLKGRAYGPRWGATYGEVCAAMSEVACTIPSSTCCTAPELKDCCDAPGRPSCECLSLTSDEAYWDYNWGNCYYDLIYGDGHDCFEPINGVAK